MLPYDEFKAAAARIPYQYRHPEFLYSLVKWLRPKTVVEVGTHIGMSAVWMARGLQENGEGTLWCIDSFCWRDQPTQEKQWFDNIVACGVYEKVTLIKGRSQEVEWPHLDMAYIDGSHTYAACSGDTIKAVTNGASCVVLNDTATCEGVQRWSDTLRRDCRLEFDFLEVPFDAGLLIMLRKQPRPKATQPDYDPWDIDDHNFHELNLRDQ